MTKVSERKTRLSFETDAGVRSWGTEDHKRRSLTRNIIVDVGNGWHGGVRLKDTRQKFAFSWQGLYEWAAEQHARRVRAERKDRR